MAAARTAEGRTLRQHQHAQLETIKVSSQARRNAIRLIGGDRMARKVLYSLVSRAMKTDLAKVREQCTGAIRCCNSGTCAEPGRTGSR